MKCDKCGKEATVTVKAIINGLEHDFHLCNSCLEEYKKLYRDGDGIKSVNLNDNNFRKLFEKMIPSLDDVIDSYYEYKYNKNNYDYDYMSSLNQGVCPVCGNLESNIKMGVFGCPDCYKLDSSLSKNILKTKNNYQAYKGHYPRRHRNFLNLADKIKNLQEKLQISIETEDFEEAKNLKDEIDRLNTKVRNW